MTFNTRLVDSLYSSNWKHIKSRCTRDEFLSHAYNVYTKCVVLHDSVREFPPYYFCALRRSLHEIDRDNAVLYRRKHGGEYKPFIRDNTFDLEKVTCPVSRKVDPELMKAAFAWASNSPTLHLAEVAKYRAQCLPYRDIATILGISPGRAQQIGAIFYARMRRWFETRGLTLEDCYV